MGLQRPPPRPQFHDRLLPRAERRAERGARLFRGPSPTTTRDRRLHLLQSFVGLILTPATISGTDLDL
jgi:hypothetical protein